MAEFPTAPTTDDLERGVTLAPRFDANGLVAAIAQYGIEWMMLAPNSGVANVMAKKPGWRKLYGD